VTDTTVVWIRTFWLVNLMERGYLHDEIIVGEGVRLKGNTLPPPPYCIYGIPCVAAEHGDIGLTCRTNWREE
jgi:hypothetical protein